MKLSGMIKNVFFSTVIGSLVLIMFAGPALSVAAGDNHAPEESPEPYLSNLEVTKNDPLFATYAAPLQRSEYIVDEGYQFKFYEPGKGIRFYTDHAGSWGLIFKKGDEIARSLNDLYREPTVTTSYSDLVKYHYQPFKNVKVSVFFQVYSSKLAIQDIRITNTGSEPVSLEYLPYLNLPESAGDVKMHEKDRMFYFTHRQEPDGWTERKHDVPHQTKRMNLFLTSESDAVLQVSKDKQSLLSSFSHGAASDKKADTAGAISFSASYTLDSGESKSLRIIRGVENVFHDKDKFVRRAEKLLNYKMDQAVKTNEQLYKSIPKLDFDNRDKKLMYWNAYNLIRQCMLPAEAKTSYNHYVYSREPTWGWGHAGQVFHESLSMLAYVFMDPESAEDSQRLYMERQWSNGYIEYRAGPYLDAMNYVRGEFTSSAPWFNYENWEIFKVSKDTAFLKEAYESGASFYKWWLRNRDKDGDGLAEWGGHAVLESVRDAQVALWHDVGWPANFESPDLNAMLVKEAEALANMAEVLGKKDKARHWREKARTRSTRIQEQFWDEETDFFYYLDKKDNDFTFNEKNDLKRQAITGFIPLWAGTLTKEQADRLVRTMKDPDKFWRDYGIPSLAADDPFYKPDGYWNGPVWVEWQYLIMNGLLEHGYNEEANELADRVFENVIYELKNSHTFWEFYSPDEKWGGYHQTYIWTGIVARMLIELKKGG